jgi:hypothetical protein
MHDLRGKGKIMNARTVLLLIALPFSSSMADVAGFGLQFIKSGTGDGTIKIDGVEHAMPITVVESHDNKVNIEAVPAAGSGFSHWEGDATGTLNPMVFTMPNRAAAIYVNFGPMVVAPDRFDFNGTAEGWNYDGPYDNFGNGPFHNSRFYFHWNDRVNYPNPIGNDPSGDQKGSMTLEYDGGPSFILNSPGASFWIIPFISPDLSNSPGWQTANGFSVEIDQMLGASYSYWADLHVKVYDTQQQKDRYFYGDTQQIPFDNVNDNGPNWIHLSFDWSKIPNFPTQRIVKQIQINLSGKANEGIVPFIWVGVGEVLPGEGYASFFHLDHVAPIQGETRPTPPPDNAIALTGYDHAIPLAWKPPSNVSASNPVRGYNVKQYDQSGAYTQIAQAFPKPHFRDASVNNGENYYYRILADYDNGLSDPSNTAQGKAQADGYRIQSKAAHVIPTIDGVINPDEWSGAASVDITYPGLSGPVTLYVMNNATRLFLAADDRRDTHLDNGDQLYAFFDKNLDREWSSTATEGNFGIYWDSGSNAAVAMSRRIQGDWPDNLSLGGYEQAQGVLSGISASSGHVQYEVAIDLGSALIQASPSGTVGALFGTYDHGSGTFTGSWPQSAEQLKTINSEVAKWGKYPFAFGDLSLAAYQPEPDITSDPASWNYGSVPAGTQSDKTFSISNAGNAALNVVSATLAGANASEFSIQSGGGAFSLAPGAARSITVRFSPTSAGGKSAALSVASNDPDENPFIVGLTGTGNSAPRSLIAMSGYDRSVPLYWVGPYNPPQDNPPTGYNITRIDPAGNIVHVANNINSQLCCYRDTTAENGVTYSYTIWSVLTNGEKDASDTAEATAHADGFVLHSGTASVPPTIDGVIGSGEWSGAGTADITYPAGAGSVTFYARNDADYLYVAVDDGRDHTLNTNHIFYLCFDGNRNRQWPANFDPAVPSEEGAIRLSWNGTSSVCTYRGLSGNWIFLLLPSTVIVPSGVSHGVSASSGNVQYEMKIPLSTVLHSRPGSTIGMLLAVSAPSSSFDGWWPQELANKLPADLPERTAAVFGYGDLVLANPAAQIMNATFQVTCPSNTPASAFVYLTGSFNDWNAAGNKMVKTGNNQWEVMLQLVQGQAVEYKYTRGTWATVEKGPKGEEIANRAFTMPLNNCLRYDAVARWADLPSGVLEDASRKVTDFNLGQNYPNPFNPSTTIPFDVKESCRVVLKVYDAAGREVSRIVDANYAPGAYRVLFDATGFAPGIYLYRIEMGHFRAMRKMVVVE